MIARTAAEFVDKEVMPKLDRMDEPKVELMVTALRKVGELSLY
jgi:hypothetical protein